jgi:hypothetical protein
MWLGSDPLVGRGPRLSSCGGSLDLALTPRSAGRSVGRLARGVSHLEGPYISTKNATLTVEGEMGALLMKIVNDPAAGTAYLT